VTENNVLTGRNRRLKKNMKWDASCLVLCLKSLVMIQSGTNCESVVFMSKIRNISSEIVWHSIGEAGKLHHEVIVKHLTKHTKTLFYMLTSNSIKNTRNSHSLIFLWQLCSVIRGHTVRGEGGGEGPTFGWNLLPSPSPGCTVSHQDPAIIKWITARKAHSIFTPILKSKRLKKKVK
jgi:hypothetical protein